MSRYLGRFPPGPDRDPLFAELERRAEAAGLTLPPHDGGHVIPAALLPEILEATRARNPLAPYRPISPWPRPSLRARLRRQLDAGRERLALWLAPWLEPDPWADR